MVDENFTLSFIQQVSLEFVHLYQEVNADGSIR